MDLKKEFLVFEMDKISKNLPHACLLPVYMLPFHIQAHPGNKSRQFIRDQILLLFLHDQRHRDIVRQEEHWCHLRSCLPSEVI